MRERVRNPPRVSTPEWRTVEYRKKETKETSFFMCGFPDTIMVADFWRTFKPVGNLTDVYVARRKRYNKENYGFLRFKNVQDPAEMERRIKNTLIRGHNINANVSDVPRRPLKLPGYNQGSGVCLHNDEVQNMQEIEEGEIVERRFSPGNGHPTFASVVGGKKPDPINTSLLSPPAVMAQRKVCLPSDAGAYAKSFYNRSLIGEARDGEHLTSVKALKSEGPRLGFDVVYVGGLHVLLVFDNPSMSEEFHRTAKEQWSDFFTDLEIWKGQKLEIKRVAGLRIVGVPLSLQEDITYNVVAASMGQILWPSFTSWLIGDGNVGEVHVLTTEVKPLDGPVMIEWDGHEFEIFVKETNELWKPTFEEYDTIPEMQQFGPDNAGLTGVEEGEVWSDELSVAPEDDGPESPEKMKGHEELNGLGSSSKLDSQGAHPPRETASPTVTGDKQEDFGNCNRETCLENGEEGNCLEAFSGPITCIGPKESFSDFRPNGTKPKTNLSDPGPNGSITDDDLEVTSPWVRKHKKNLKADKREKKRELLRFREKDFLMRGGRKATIWNKLILNKHKRRKAAKAAESRNFLDEIEMLHEVGKTKELGDLIGANIGEMDDAISGAIRGEQNRNQ
ncbi:hypothetical protein SSX86_010699 [Deinandra increscens subsp. villosa]|uniref:RRM domain-containing protein n=1 Tax=Deinandra increscens subsp. villosa TaxID=3103831 RepID=A0AAP0DFR7_9ASTR